MERDKYYQYFLKGEVPVLKCGHGRDENLKFRIKCVPVDKFRKRYFIVMYVLWFLWYMVILPVLSNLHSWPS
jgi:hypothetical protein